MSKISIKFDTNLEKINKQLFVFEPSLTIREMLNIFLRDTESKSELSLDQIQFVFKGKILNSPQFFDLHLRDIFRFSNHKVKVWDSKNIIGGNIRFY